MLKRNLFGLGFYLLISVLYAQDAAFDTSVLLNEISINSYRFEQFADGNKRQEIDSLSQENHIANSLAEALNTLTMLSLKSYGISGNTSISLRGTSASQTAILWNGINLQDPLNGSANLELIPIMAVDKIEVQYGGSGALYGSGAIGGAILLQTKAQFKTGFKTKLNVGFGSFGSYFSQFGIQNGGQKMATSLKLFYRQAKNNFPFVNTQQFGHPATKQTNAAVEFFGLSQDSRFLLTENQQINTHFWFQQSSRELPPNMTSLISQQNQDDRSFRFSGDHLYSRAKIDVMTRLAFLNSKLNYTDSLAAIFAEHLSNSALLESELNYKLHSNQVFNIGVHERLDWGKSENYKQIEKRNKLAFLLSYKMWTLSKRLNLSTSIREELVDRKWSPPTPSLGISYQTTSSLKFSGRISRNFRQPNFNDLFWKGGFAQGNPNLLAETAWSQDLGVLYQYSKDKKKLDLSLSAFNISIKNMILWLPSDQGIWSPVNKKEVWSRGLESDLKFSQVSYRIHWQFDLHYSYNPSTLRKVAENESESILNKQLTYTPLHQAKALISLKHRLGSISLEQLYISKRFTTSDNSRWLKGYPLSNLIISTSFQKRKQNWGLSFRINNLFDQAYQSMLNYALPGRNYQINIHYKLN